MHKGKYFKDTSNQFNRFHGTSCSEQGLLGIAGGNITWSNISLETSIQVINVYTLVKVHNVGIWLRDPQCKMAYV